MIVDELRATEEEIAALEAVKVARLASAMRIALTRMAKQQPTQRMREMELRSIAAEIGAAMRWSDRVTQHRMPDALDLTERFPATVDALTAGTSPLGHTYTDRVPPRIAFIPDGKPPPF